MKIDLHVHCCERSPCSVASEIGLIQRAISAGLDAITFTDHDRLVPAAHLAELNQRFSPFCIFGGIEITLPEEHILVFGVQDPVLESRNWDYEALWRFVHQKGGFMILAHPFRFQGYIGAPIDPFPPDGIEIHSLNTSPRHEGRIRSIGEQLGLRLFSNSDAHVVSMIGRYYNQIEAVPASSLPLALALKNGPVVTSP